MQSTKGSNISLVSGCMQAKSNVISKNATKLSRLVKIVRRKTLFAPVIRSQ